MAISSSTHAHEEMPEAEALHTTGNNESRYANAHPRTGCRIHETAADMRSLCHRRAVPCVPSRCGQCLHIFAAKIHTFHSYISHRLKDGAHPSSLIFCASCYKRHQRTQLRTCPVIQNHSQYIIQYRPLREYGLRLPKESSRFPEDMRKSTCKRRPSKNNCVGFYRARAKTL